MLSHSNRSNWHIFDSDGPKPEVYDKLPIVYTGSRHGVKTERIVRERQPSSAFSKLGGSESAMRKPKGRAQGGDEAEHLERNESSNSSIEVMCEGDETRIDGVMTKQDDEFVISSKGSKYSLKKFANLAGFVPESELDAMKRIKILETGESLGAYLENQSLKSSGKAPAAKCSTSTSGDSGGMHFFDEETPG